ncbi:hypothetical protein [Streptomyces sp. NPDC014894]|uniref:hypothetical protein n=1 Tax=unclassified Streptomyces TaxID=2593676 RepID=UPI0036F6607B
MSRYRIQYSGHADKVHAEMPAAFRLRFDAEIARTLGEDPYGHGSGPAGSPKEEDRRLASVAGALVRYYIAGPPLLVVTAVKIVHF